MIVPLKLATFKNETVLDVIKHEFKFLPDRLETCIQYWYEIKDQVAKETLFCNENVAVKRKLINGYCLSFSNENDVWEIKIFVMGSCDIVISFDTEAEARDFEELTRKYIFEDMKCTT